MFTANHIQILQHIYAGREITRADLGQFTTLSQATIVRLVADLRAQGLVMETRLEESHAGPGRPTAALRINPKSGFVIGLEFGRDHLIACVIDASAQVVYWRQHDAAPPFVASGQTMDVLADIVRAAANEAGLAWDQVRGVGLALHGVASANGEWMPWPHSINPYPARQHLAERLGQMVYVEDVSRAFAEAEHRFGAGIDAPDMIYLFIGGSGVGSGIFVNNMLLKSSLGVCGEIGHIIVQTEGALCQCGNRGCLETVATHEAVVARLRERLEKGVVSVLENDETLSFARICEAARAGDKEAYIALSDLAHFVARALSGTVNIVGATVVLIGGQLRLAGDGFLADLSSALHQCLIPVLAPRVTVDYATLPAYAGAWGVAAQALDAAWNDRSFFEEADRTGHLTVE